MMEGPNAPAMESLADTVPHGRCWPAYGRAGIAPSHLMINYHERGEAGGAPVMLAVQIVQRC